MKYVMYNDRKINYMGYYPNAGSTTKILVEDNLH